MGKECFRIGEDLGTTGGDALAEVLPVRAQPGAVGVKVFNRGSVCCIVGGCSWGHSARCGVVWCGGMR